MNKKKMEETKEEFFISDDVELREIGPETDFLLPTVDHLYNRQSFFKSQVLAIPKNTADFIGFDKSGVINLNESFWSLNRFNRNFDLNGNDVDCSEEIHLNRSSNFNNLLMTSDDKRSLKSTASSLSDSIIVNKNKERGECINEIKSDVEIEDEKMPVNGDDLSNVFSTSKEIQRQNHDGDDNIGLWHSGPSHFFMDQNRSASSHHEDLPATLISSLKLKDESFDNGSQSARTYSHQQLGVKVEMVYNLLSMLGTNNREDMSKTFLAMSSSVESCHAMRQSGCIPLLVQLIHSPELDWEVKDRASKALHNIVHAQSDDKRRRREIRVLKLLEHVRDFCEVLRSKFLKKNDAKEATRDSNEHPVAATGALMKFSFDAEHRQAICTLGGLQTISELLQVDQEAHGCPGDNEDCLTLRRYACMSLTNLTFGDGKNKALLCGSHKFISALVDQLKSPSEDLRQVTASVLRNLSWRADSESKDMLRGSGAITSLTIAAMEAKKESTLKSMLSALWNLSAHCSMNKVDICCVPGALAFLVKMLRYKSTSNTLAIVENAGGIIRNVSSHIAVREDYRQILRDNNCFEILLEQLRSSSLTIVSNACGTLWNLSARCMKDQRKLWEMGAANMLRNLVQSKHKMISMGSSAALKNLLSANPNGNLNGHLDATAKSLGYDNLPTLTVRKQRALEQEINITLAETCDDVESIALSCQTDKIQNDGDNSKIFDCVRSDSRESLRSSKSDSVYERLNQKIDQERTTERNAVMHESLNERQRPQKIQDQKLIKRYRSSMIPTPVLSKHLNEEKSSSNGLPCSVAGTENPREEKGKFKRGIPVFKARIKNSTFTGSEGSFDCALNNKSKSDVDFKSSATSSKENNFEVAQSKLISPKEEYCSFGEFPREILIKDEKEQLGQETSINSFCGSHQCADISDPVAHDIGDTEFSSGPTRKTASSQDSRKKIITKKSYEKGEEKDSLGSGNLSSKVASDVPSNTSYDFGIREAPVFHFEEPQLSVSRGSDEKFRNCVSTSGSQDVSVNDPEVVPNFKIGSEISDTKCFQSEANKICQAIRKCQDMDSTSQISVVSCSSFLDTADYSLFDFTHESTDFDNWDDNPRDKNVDLIGYAPTKYFASNLNDNLTLPSLESSKIEPIDAFDLESSMISVASIVSEIAENNSNTQDSECTSTLWNKTYEGATNLRVEDPRVFDDSNDCTDEDNSLVSQENLPWDSRTIEEASLIEARKKMTPKEKRKLVSDRYRTYTIRDFRTSHQQENAQEHNQEAEDWGDILTNFHKSTEQNHYESFNACNLPACERMNGTGQHRKNSDAILKPSHDVEENETTVGSKSLTDLSKIGPFERKELVDNARMVALSFKTAVLGIDSDANVTIDSEGEYSQRSLEIDTTTYSKESRKALLPLWDDHRCSQIEENTMELTKPIISKAAEEQRKIEKTSEKSSVPGVRGKRRPLYSSAMKNVRRDSTPPASPKISQVKSSVEAKKYKLTTTKSLPNVPKSVFLLEREATFTKKQSLMPSKTISVTETVLHPKKVQSKLSTHQKSINRIQTNSVEGGKLGNRRSLSAAGRNSSSPDELATARINQTNLKPSVPSSNTNQKEKSRKEVESKIAKLWKMAEEAKEKNKNTKDRRVWIAPEKNYNCIDKTFEPDKRGEVFEICSGTSNNSEGTSSC